MATRVNPTTSARGAQLVAAVAAPKLPRGFTPDAVAQYQRVAPKFEDGFLACAQLPFLPDMPTAKREAQKLGMREQVPGFFAHADGSWLAGLSNGRFERGVGTKVFQGVPQSPTRMGAIDPQMSHFKLAVGDAAVLAVKAQDAKSLAVLAGKGFKASNANVYTHADRSFVAFAGGKVYRGVNGSIFRAAPSYEGLPKNAMDTDAILCASPLWGLPTDPATAKKELLARGFRETRNGYFALDDLWVAFSGGKMHMGTGEEIYPKPPHVDQIPKTKSDGIHGHYAVAKTADLTAETAGLGRKLAALKFKSYTGGLYDHEDGSWVAVVGKKLYRGFEDLSFSDVPKAPKKGEYAVYDKLPSETWDWFAKNTALGRTPVMSDQAEARRTLGRLGYKKPTGNNTKWVHPDGSWFDLAGYGMSPGFQKWPLGQLPYNNRRPG